MDLKAYSSQSPKRGWSWETPPDPIPEAEITETLTADVAIIGGGISGLAAGARLTQLGKSVLIVDRYQNLLGRAGHVGVLDSAVMRRQGVSIDKAQFARDWLRVSGSRVNEELLWLYIRRSGEAFDWLLSQTAGAVDAELYSGFYKGPGFREYPGTHVVYQKAGETRYQHQMGGMLVVEILEKTILENGGRIFRPVRAMQLEKDGQGRVTSFLARSETDGLCRRYVGRQGVVVATGDIEGDKDLLEAFCPRALAPTVERYWPKGNNTGDGHKMLYWAGAAFDDPDWALSLHGRRDEGASYYSLHFLYVNDRGQRFMNEDSWTQGKSLRLLAQYGQDVGYTIMDGKWLEDYGRCFHLVGGQAVTPHELSNLGVVWDPNCSLQESVELMVQKGVCAWRADSLEELAAQTGLPADALQSTVARYNQLAALGQDLDFGKRSELLSTIVEPPFYAMKWGTALLDVFGGALTDAQMRVLDVHNRPIPGLYAVGNAAGGFYGVDYPLLLNGNSFGRALTWALCLAEGM